MKDNKEKVYNSYTILDAFRCFFILIVLLCLVSCVYSLVVSIVASGMGITSDELSSRDSVAVIGYILSPVTIIVFFVIYNKVRKIKASEAFSDGQKISLLPISVAIVLSIISIFLFTPMMNLFEYLFSGAGYIVDNTIPLQEKMCGSFGYFALGILIYALLPAIAEEILFRGVIQKGLMSKLNGFASIMISTLLFVLLHGSLQQTAYQLVAGIILGYLACVGGSIVYSIIFHFLSNTFVLLFGCFEIVPYLAETGYPNFYSMVFPICLFMLGCVLAGILFWVLKYLRNKNFFRFDKESVAEFERRKKQPAPKRFRFFTYLKDESEPKERLFIVFGIILAVVIWIINTAAGFMN